MQPDPEDEERVCIGVLVQESTRKPEVLYDPRFSRLRCVAPGIDVDLVNFYVEEIRQALTGSPGDPAAMVDHYGPTFAVSEPRKVSVPLSDRGRLQLLQRFVLRSPVRGLDAEKAARVAPAEAAFAEHLEEVVRSVSTATIQRVTRQAKPQQIIGFPIPAVRPIALAVELDSLMVLVDGVDLKAMKPARAVSKVNQVSHTFWQYTRVEPNFLDRGLTVRRVGVILNGVPHGDPGYADAHDYAVHQFRKEADVTYDTWSGQGRSELETALQPQR
jgi:hypothetical protein